MATIELVFVDADIVVANKPPSGHAIQRLDRGTSGALLFARSASVAGAREVVFQNQLSASDPAMS
jgi:23S rRNA-/tRNA-specific pseudouridylate synthase